MTIPLPLEQNDAKKSQFILLILICFGRFSNMSRRGRRIADVDSPIATVKTLFGSDGALAGGGDGDSSGTFVYYILSCTFIL